MTLLRVEGLSKSFGGVQAVQGISFALAEGELLALIGPNGAGKTTTFNMAGGQLAPDGGRVVLDGRDITGLPPRAIWRLGVGRTFQIAQTLMSFTVLENVQMALLSHDGHAWRWWRRAAAHRPQDALALLAQVGMQEQAQRPCSELAYGDVKRVELAIALAHAPRLLLMDEPTAGMAPAERVTLMQLVRRIARERRMGVLFTEHSMDVVFGQADRVAVLVRGQLLAEGTPEAIRQDARVQAAYLGSSENDSCQRLIDKRKVPKTPLLAVEGLHAWYGAAHILHGVSLTVGRGEVVALMGRNGAGKSTTLKSIAGLLARTEGRVDFLGQPLRGKAPHQIARAGLGYVPEDRRIFTDLTVLENLEAGRQPPRAWSGGEPAPHWTTERLFQLFPNLGEMPHRPGGRMSGGEQQMLTVARTLMGQPFMVLLDEPSEGVAPVIVEQMAHAIRALKEQGVGILLSEQNLHLAEAVADRVCVLEKGRIVHAAPMVDFAGDAQARQAYLGV
ncbi:ATP-binding cassette domain-containing protein [Acidovorax sp. MR-S7]|uniref:ATP-binding cassette domain-containing protein n=1 Tax=Acidovorax sp. MR-S7 TaxID=1268622 RepID=UPI0003755D62|nr:ATP-binding cassette domain-containing protein [Acidovorax sp. MR-S7]GAD20545.1 ABC-type branched-chain amino acid transport systems, ATPase component [Acidovorax sp. MR-S7]